MNCRKKRHARPIEYERLTVLMVSVNDTESHENLIEYTFTLVGHLAATVYLQL